MAITTNVEIKRLDQKEIVLRMVGKTPLYFNSMSAKTKRDLLIGGGKKTAAEKQQISNTTLRKSLKIVCIKKIMEKLCFVFLRLVLNRRWLQRLLRLKVSRKLL